MGPARAGPRFRDLRWADQAARPQGPIALPGQVAPVDQAAARGGLGLAAAAAVGAAGRAILEPPRGGAGLEGAAAAGAAVAALGAAVEAEAAAPAAEGLGFEAPPPPARFSFEKRAPDRRINSFSAPL